MVTKYFSQLFTASGTDGSLSLRESVEQVTEVQNMRLMAQVSAEEVKVAAFAMHPDKSPG